MRRHPLASYFILAYTISWFIWLPLVLARQGWTGETFSPYFTGLGIYGTHDGSDPCHGRHPWHARNQSPEALFFVLITFPIAVIYTWLYNGSGGRLLITSLWSTSMTLAIGSAAAIGIVPIIMTGFLFITAMILTNHDRTLSKDKTKGNYSGDSHFFEKYES